MMQLSTAEIEKQIAGYKLQFDATKDDEIEWRFQPPAFVVSFIRFSDEFQRIPSQSEFAEFYVALNRATLNDEFSKWQPRERPAKKRALLARLGRAYPSFVRDVYLFALLRENGVPVDYDTTQDVQAGVDLSVSIGTRKIQVHVFLDSPRSLHGRAKKDQRHHFTGEHIDLVLRKTDCKIVGEFWLPTLEHVAQLKHTIFS
jgi:hypothetical protein